MTLALIDTDNLRGRMRAQAPAAPDWVRESDLVERPGLLAELISSTPMRRDGLLEDPRLRVQAVRDVRAEILRVHTRAGEIDGRAWTGIWIAEHAANLSLPPSVFRPLHGDEQLAQRFLACLDIATSLLGHLLPRQHGRHYQRRALLAARARIEREMPDLDLDGRVGRELLRLAEIDCAAPHRWHRVNQHLYLWHRLCDPDATWDQAPVSDGYDAYIDELVARHCVVQRIDLPGRLAFGRRRLANADRLAAEKAASRTSG